MQQKYLFCNIPLVCIYIFLLFFTKKNNKKVLNEKKYLVDHKL